MLDIFVVFILIYVSFVQSILMFEIEFWHWTYNSHTQILKNLLKKFISYILYRSISNDNNINNTLNVQELNQIFIILLLLLLYWFKYMLNTCPYSYTTRHHNNINLLKYKCNTNFGKLNPLIVWIDICIQLNINILNFKKAITFRKYINNIPL